MPKIGSVTQAIFGQQSQVSPMDIKASESRLADLMTSGGPEKEKEIQALSNLIDAQKNYLSVVQNGTPQQLQAAEKALDAAQKQYDHVINDRQSNLPSPQMSAQEMAQAEVTAKARKTEDAFLVSAQQVDINSKLES